MGLNDTPSGERVHIGFFGRRNAGKSSLVNAVTGQEIAVVSDTRGTTTDPVKKAMELLPIGPVLVIDTPGFDDTGALGEKRVRQTKRILNRTDIAVLVVDGVEGLQDSDRELLALFEEKGIPFLLVYNKADLLETFPEETPQQIFVSALKKENIDRLKEKLAQYKEKTADVRYLVRDLLHPGDLVVLVIPLDGSAPKGRLILPQQLVIRDVLEAGAAAVCVRDSELSVFLHQLEKKPAMVITDSQAFGKVSALVPEDILLTSFSILMARYKGLLETAVHGVSAVDDLKDGDRILIAEGCTHHRQCEDIGTVKIPAWLKKHTGKNLVIETCSGQDFPEDLSPYALVIHCGGCMLNEREVRYRMKCAQDQAVFMTNYGIAIAYMHGILKRSVQIFSDLYTMLP